MIIDFSIVDESGVSIYSVSKEAETELPNMDPNLRSAGKLNFISILFCLLIAFFFFLFKFILVGLARRLQDPLLEYVKIEPKHLGVGQYQVY